MSASQPQHLAARFEAAIVHDDPFPHLVIDDFLHPHFFAELMSKLPAPSRLHRLSDAGNPALADYRHRRTLALGPDLGESWERLAAMLSGPPMKQRLFEALGIGPIVTRYFAALNCDEAGASLLPHTDAPSKLVSAILYLRQEPNGRGVGTSIYRPLQIGRVCAGGPHYPRYEFEPVKEIEFRPNRLFAFAKSETSFHGVEEIPASASPRYTVLFALSKAQPGQ